MTLPARRPDEAKADLELLASIIYYIQMFPARMHHPKKGFFLWVVHAVGKHLDVVNDTCES